MRKFSALPAISAASAGLHHPDATATAHSKLCGSTVTVDLSMRDGVVTDFAHDVKACALGQASSSIMAEHVVGASADELRAVRETMRKMLKENGPPPEGRFADLKYLEPVRDYKARHASTMLTFDAVVDAIGQIEKKAGGSGGLGQLRRFQFSASASSNSARSQSAKPSPPDRALQSGATRK